MFNKALLDKKDKRNCFRRVKRSKTEKGRIFTQFYRKKIVMEKIAKKFKERNFLFTCVRCTILQMLLLHPWTFSAKLETEFTTKRAVFRYACRKECPNDA